MNHFNRSNQQRHVLFIFLLSLFCGLGSAQECACSPSEYKFTLDFSLVCPPVNITRNGGVESTYCQISGFGGPDEDITDLVPVRGKFSFDVDILMNAMLKYFFEYCRLQ